ncbi:MAG: hypothetical protein PVJ92_03105 [Candidatus Dependentiae bacterium]|jgi:hypothetical protein
MFCTYYYAQAVKEKMWLLMAHLKSFDSIAFHRTVDGTNDQMEFFVPPAHDKLFRHFLELYTKEGILEWYEQRENRLAGKSNKLASD